MQFSSMRCCGSVNSCCDANNIEVTPESRVIASVAEKTSWNTLLIFTLFLLLINVLVTLTYQYALEVSLEVSLGVVECRCNL